jgi:predicted transcriptional regulator
MALIDPWREKPEPLCQLGVRICAALKGTGGLTAHQISNRLMLDHTRANTALRELIADGVIEREEIDNWRSQAKRKHGRYLYKLAMKS